MPKYYPPSRTNLEIARWLGLSIKAETGNVELTAQINSLKSDPRYQPRYEAYLADVAARSEKTEREELGNELYEEYARWNRLDVPGAQYLARFRKGKLVHTDVVELDGAEAHPERSRRRIEVTLLLPKIKRDRVAGNYLEWEKDVVLEPSQILSIDKLEEAIDLFDVERYAAVLEGARRDQTENE